MHRTICEQRGTTNDTNRALLLSFVVMCGVPGDMMGLNQTVDINSFPTNGNIAANTWL